MQHLQPEVVATPGCCHHPHPVYFISHTTAVVTTSLRPPPTTPPAFRFFNPTHGGLAHVLPRPPASSHGG